MKKYIFAFTLLLAALQVSAHEKNEPNNAFVKANELYTQGCYNEAIDNYENILSIYGVSPELYYNLGNAYYKTNQMGLSILNYERALRLMPTYENAKHNLALARLKTTDKIEDEQEEFLKNWALTLMNLFPSNVWIWINLGNFLVFIVTSFIFAFATQMKWRRIGFRMATIFLGIFIVGAIFAGRTAAHFNNRADAIVMAGVSTLKSSPDESGNDLFVLHEGTKVTIIETVGEWHEVRFGNGNIGWIKTKAVERI